MKEDIEIDDSEFLRDTAMIEAEMHERLLAEWEEWENEYERLPAKIEVIVPNKQGNEITAKAD